MLRIDGELHPLPYAVTTAEQVYACIFATMNATQRQTFETQLDMDYIFILSDGTRFRVNVFQHYRGPGAVFRVIPQVMRTLEDLRLPKVFSEHIAKLNHGLVLVTGATGSGKSTTLAAIINFINKHRCEHIMSLEDPIEYIHKPDKCLIHQREINEHTKDFHTALRSTMREDPDILLVGEIRDAKTMALTMTAAETGHLVFATLHTRSAAKTVHRIIDMFAAEDKATARAMLSESLQAVTSQVLIKKSNGGRVAACEILLGTPAVRNLIREDKIAQMQNVMQTGQEHGMQTLDQHIKILVEQDIISPQSAQRVQRVYT